MLCSTFSRLTMNPEDGGLDPPPDGLQQPTHHTTLGGQAARPPATQSEDVSTPSTQSLPAAACGGVAAAELHSVAEPTAAARQGCKARTIDVRGCWTLRRAAGALWLARSDLGSVDDWGRRRRLGRVRPCHADHCRSSLEATCVCHELWRSLVGQRNVADHDRRARS